MRNIPPSVIIAQNWDKYLTTDPQLLSLSGYCFGALYAVDLAATDSLVAGMTFGIRVGCPFGVLFTIFSGFCPPRLARRIAF